MEKVFAMAPRPMIEFIKEQNNKTGLVGVEIGTNEGVNAYYILSNLPIKKLYLVDPYQKYGACSDYGVPEDWDPEKAYVRAQKRLRRFRNKVTFINKKSIDALTDLPEEVDFIYLDSTHRYEGVIKDIELYFPKVRTGGVFGGHDFNAKNQGVPRAVLEFAESQGLPVQGKWTDWWIHKQP